jgi:hypothetical protein
VAVELVDAAGAQRVVEAGRKVRGQRGVITFARGDVD